MTPEHLKPADREGLAREILLAHVRATCEPEDIRDAESGRWHAVELTGEDALAVMLEFAALPPEAERVEIPAYHVVLKAMREAMESHPFWRKVVGTPAENDLPVRAANIAMQFMGEM